MDRESVGAMLARLGHLAGLEGAGGGPRQNTGVGGRLTWGEIGAYLPSEFEAAKMAEVTYIDLNEYVI